MADDLRSSTLPLLGSQLCNDLLAVFVSSGDILRHFILGGLVLVATASVHLDRLLFADRLATLTVDAESAAALATCGLFADAAPDGGLRCFHCGVVVLAAGAPPPPPAASPGALWAAHRAASPGCYLARLGLVVASPASAAAAESGLQADARRQQPMLRRLRQLLDSPVVAAAAGYGFEPAALRLLLARHFMRNGCATVDRPGDLIRLAQEAEADGLPDGARRIDLLRMLDCAVAGVAGPAVSTDTASEPLAPPPPPPPPPLAADNPAETAATLEADDLCVQCRSRTRNRVTLPCAHFLLCDRCLDSLSRCPRCSQLIAATVTAFIT